MTDVEVEVAVVGGGLAGLACAASLEAAGRRVAGFEAAPRVGGRLAAGLIPCPDLATASPLRFDAGAQYLTARDPDFRAFVEDAARRGHIGPWSARFVEGDETGILRPARPKERWVGMPSMSDLVAPLVRDATWRVGCEVASLTARAGGWELRDARGARRGRARRVVLALPPSRAHALLPESSPLHAIAGSVRMRPEIVLGLVFAAPPALAADGFYLRAGPLAWAARERSKPGRGPAEVWSLRADAAWSAARARTGDDAVAAALLAALQALSAEALPPIVGRRLRRWKDSTPAPARPERTLVDADRGLALAGDWCGGPRIEGAWRSGRAAAAALID